MSDLTWSTLLEFAWDPHLVGLNQSKVCAENVHKELKQEYVYVLLNSNGVPTLAGRRKQLKLCSLFQMMNGQVPSQVLLMWEDQLSTSGTQILTILYNQLYTQLHIRFPSFPMLSLCGTNYQTLCMTLRLSSHSSTRCCIHFLY